MGSVVTYYSRNDPDFTVLEEQMVGKEFYMSMPQFLDDESNTIDDGIMIRCTNVMDDEHGLRIGWEWNDDDDFGGNQENVVEEYLSEFALDHISHAKPYTD